MDIRVFKSDTIASYLSEGDRHEFACYLFDDDMGISQMSMRYSNKSKSRDGLMVGMDFTIRGSEDILEFLDLVKAIEFSRNSIKLVKEMHSGAMILSGNREEIMIYQDFQNPYATIRINFDKIHATARIWIETMVDIIESYFNKKGENLDTLSEDEIYDILYDRQNFLGG